MVTQVCNHQLLVTAIFGLSVFFLVLQVPYLFFVAPGSALFVVSVLNVLGLLVFVIGSGTGLWYCRRRETSYSWQN